MKKQIILLLISAILAFPWPWHKKKVQTQPATPPAQQQPADQPAIGCKTQFCDDPNSEDDGAEKRQASNSPMITRAFSVTAPPPLPDCPGLLPICSGGLLPQTASTLDINAYEEKYKIGFPAGCRYVQPPRCFKGEKRTCEQQCTP